MKKKIYQVNELLLQKKFTENGEKISVYCLVSSPIKFMHKKLINLAPESVSRISHKMHFSILKYCAYIFYFLSQILCFSCLAKSVVVVVKVN
jgi:hypothetical protein